MNPDTEESRLDLPGDNKPRLTHADPGLTYRGPCNPIEIPRYPSHFPLGSPLLFSNVGPGLMDAPEREGKIHSGGSGGIDNSNTQRESKHVEVPNECRAYKDGRTRDDQRSLSPVNHRVQMLEHYQQELFNRQNDLDRWVYERLYSSNKDQNMSADADRKKEQKSGDGDKCEKEDEQDRRKKEFVAKTSSSSESDRRDRFVTDRRKKVSKVKADRSTSEYESGRRSSDRDVRRRDSVNLDVRSESRHNSSSSVNTPELRTLAFFYEIKGPTSMVRLPLDRY